MSFHGFIAAAKSANAERAEEVSNSLKRTQTQSSIRGAADLEASFSEGSFSDVQLESPAVSFARTEQAFRTPPQLRTKADAVRGARARADQCSAASTPADSFAPSAPAPRPRSPPRPRPAHARTHAHPNTPRAAASAHLATEVRCVACRDGLPSGQPRCTGGRALTAAPAHPFQRI